jgi:hypothetical protein
VPDLDLETYRRDAAGLPRPTELQIHDFVEFVCDAHSWYKHLPFLFPGHPFIFYLNGTAGHDLVVTRDGRRQFRTRTDDTERFHYTWMTTAAYRIRFGHLDYSTEAGTQFLYGDASRGGVVVTGPHGQPLPDAVQRAGTVQLTGVIHKLVANLLLKSRMRLRLSPHPQPHWPEETGGEETFERIRAAVLNEDSESAERLLEPERQRQKRLIREAIDGVLQIVYES